MCKKTIVAILACAFISPIVNAQWEGNWLIGASRQFAERKGHLNVSLVDTLFAFLPRTDVIQEHTDRGYVWDLIAGYQVTCNGWLLGAEVNGQWQDIDQAFYFNFPDLSGLTSFSNYVHYKTKPIIAMTGSLGYEMTPYLLPYMRLGVELSRDQLTVNFMGNSLFSPIPLTIHEKRWKAHFVGGFGVEIPIPLLTQPTLRLEYDYHCYFTHNGVAANGSIVDNLLNPAFSAEIHPITQSAKVSLIWNFG